MANEFIHKTGDCKKEGRCSGGSYTLRQSGCCINENMKRTEIK